jgi:hypothetical protein
MYTEAPIDGIAGELANNTWTLQTALVTFIAISWYNVIELMVLILCTFRRWKGLYFWSLLLTSCVGVFPYSLGFLLKFFTDVHSILSVTILTIGWWTMVTGQSFVLYSRLHLVLRDERILRRVLYMIIANFFLLHIPTTVLTYGSNVADKNSVFVDGYNIMEKIQMTGFTIQEVIISALYVSETVKLLRLSSERNKRKIMYQLIGINIGMFVMDLILLGLEYASYYAVQITLKAAIYSVKLKLEFAVLGRLVDAIHGPRRFMPGNSLALSSLPYVNGSAATQPPPPPSVHRGQDFRSASMTGAVSQAMRSEDEKSQVPDGKILTMTEFSSWVEPRPQSHAESAA